MLLHVLFRPLNPRPPLLRPPFPRNTPACGLLNSFQLVSGHNGYRLLELAGVADSLSANEIGKCVCLFLLLCFCCQLHMYLFWQFSGLFATLFWAILSITFISFRRFFAVATTSHAFVAQKHTHTRTHTHSPTHIHIICVNKRQKFAKKFSCY